MNLIPKGYKHSPFGHIPQEWDVKELCAIAKIKRGRFSPRPRNDPRFYGGRIPFVQTSDVSLSNGHISTYNQTLNEEGLKVSLLFPKGTILMTIASNIGHCAIIDIDMACPDSLVGIICEQSVDREFLNYFLQHIRQRLEYIAPGAQKNINVEFLNSLSILKPPLTEQTKIAAALNLMDEICNLNTQLIEKKELQKKAVKQQLLTGKKRLKGFTQAWSIVHLGDLFKERNEIGFEKLPLLSIGSNGIYPQTESTKIDTSNENKSKYRRICKGDIGYNTMRMWQGRSALSSLEGIISPAYTVLTPKSGTNALYFSYMFKTDTLIHKFFRNSQGLVNDTLNCKFKDFASIKVSVPTYEEQSAIANVLQAADVEIQLLKNKADKLKDQKKAMMQLLLTGKKRLKID